MVVNLVIHKPNSNNSHIGTANIIIDRASGGVTNMAIKKHPTTINRLFSTKVCVLTTPIIISRSVIIGISKVNPKTKNSFKQKAR